MSPASRQAVAVTCPTCQHRFVSPVLVLIDAAQDPEAKLLLLSGQANSASCPQCGSGGMLSTPIVYHDPEKELLFTLLPAEVGAAGADQLRLTGELTNQLISGLPAEQRKGYLLRPRTFLRLEGLLEAILEADGVTREMLEAQRARTSLLDRLLHAAEEKTRRALVDENGASLGPEFFQLLAWNLDLARSAGQSKLAESVGVLRDQLLEWTPAGREIAAREEAIRSLGRQVTREGLLEKVATAALAGETVKVEALVAAARPVIDYAFYQQLTARIEAAHGARDSRLEQVLRALRETVLDLTAEIDAVLHEATDEARRFLEQVAGSADPGQELQKYPHRVDEMFMDVLAVELQAAARSNAGEREGRLGRVRDAVLAMIEAGQPPELRLVNRLLEADYPHGTRALLEEHAAEVDGSLLALLDLLRERVEGQHEAELASALQEIRQQAAAMIASE